MSGFDLLLGRVAGALPLLLANEGLMFIVSQIRASFMSSDAVFKGCSKS